MWFSFLQFSVYRNSFHQCTPVFEANVQALIGVIGWNVPETKRAGNARSFCFHQWQ
jgi:hypothetical protein